MRVPGRRAAVLIAVAASLAGCSGSDKPSPGRVDEAAGGSVVVESTHTVGPTAATGPGDGTKAIASDDEPFATVAESGVPGIESDDPLCRGWSEFAGSFQALALLSMSAPDPAAAMRLEVVAAAAVLDAVATIEETFPTDIAGERELFVNDLLGPFSRRAERLRDELRSAGVDEAGLEMLGARWLESLAAAGVDDPEITVEIPRSMEPAVEAAVTAAQASIPAIGADPSLVVDPSAPATMAYIASNCPDRGTLGGNDVID